MKFYKKANRKLFHLCIKNFKSKNIINSKQGYEKVSYCIEFDRRTITLFFLFSRICYRGTRIPLLRSTSESWSGIYLD